MRIKGTAIKGTARLRIGMPSGDRETYISIEVEDKQSGSIALELKLTPEDFAMVTVGNGYVEAEAIWRTATLGYKHEHKSELVEKSDAECDRNNRSFKDPAVRERILGPFEVDGWKGSSDDYFNHHRSTGTHQRVGFHRYVHAVTGEPLLDEPKLVPAEPLGSFKEAARAAALKDPRK